MGGLDLSVFFVGVVLFFRGWVCLFIPRVDFSSRAVNHRRPVKKHHFFPPRRFDFIRSLIHTERILKPSWGGWLNGREKGKRRNLSRDRLSKEVAGDIISVFVPHVRIASYFMQSSYPFNPSRSFFSSTRAFESKNILELDCVPVEWMDFHYHPANQFVRLLLFSLASCVMSLLRELFSLVDDWLGITY